MSIKRIIAAGIAAIGLVAGAGTAQADTAEPSNAHYPSMCLYERWWTYEGCTLNGVTAHWVISIAQEDAAAKPKPKAKPKAKYVKVKRGQTLWRLAVIHRGSGHEWRKIARLNGIKGTTIYAGQTVRVR